MFIKTAIITPIKREKIKPLHSQGKPFISYQYIKTCNIKLDRNLTLLFWFLLSTNFRMEEECRPLH